jgi:hypothetical protein
MTRSIILGLAAVAIVTVAAGCDRQSTSGQNSGATVASVTSAPASPQAAASDQPAAQSKFVNTHCPIMGGRIDPARVPASLTREYKGQKVAFCCGMCPGAWDKLTDAQKDAKLKAAAQAK